MRDRELVEEGWTKIIALSKFRNRRALRREREARGKRGRSAGAREGSREGIGMGNENGDTDKRKL